MIRIAGVTKLGRDGVPVLDDVTLTIPEGALVGLIGPGASGKSVLVKIIAGLLRPEQGSVFIDEQDLFALSEIDLANLRKRIGMLFQNNALFDHWTVAENIAFPLRRLTDLSEEKIRERVEERLASVSLPHFGDRMPSGLSGGQKKRVGVARATANYAPIVLYDEPAAGLDPVTSQKIFDLLRAEQQSTGATVIMVSSDLDRLLTVTDYVAMLYRGKLVFMGSTQEARTTNEPMVKQFVHGLTEGPL